METERHLSSIPAIHGESLFLSKRRDFSVVNLLYSFALFALLCTCYPSLRCAENVQKCAEPKSAQKKLRSGTARQAGFQGFSERQKSQFYPDNNLT